MKEKQIVEISTKNDFDTFKVTVENSDGKEYVLILKNPKTLKNWNSDPIKTTASAGDLRKAVAGFYW